MWLYVNKILVLQVHGDASGNPIVCKRISLANAEGKFISSITFDLNTWDHYPSTSSKVHSKLSTSNSKLVLTWGTMLYKNINIHCKHICTNHLPEHTKATACCSANGENAICLCQAIFISTCDSFIFSDMWCLPPKIAADWLMGQVAVLCLVTFYIHGQQHHMVQLKKMLLDYRLLCYCRRFGYVTPDKNLCTIVNGACVITCDTLTSDQVYLD